MSDANAIKPAMNTRLMKAAMESGGQAAMATAPAPTRRTISGAFLRGDQPVDGVWIPEEQTEEHKRLIQLAREFEKNEIVPAIDRIEQKEPGLMRRLIQKACEAGIGSADIRKSYGGPDTGIGVAIMVLAQLCASESFNASLSAHAMGATPIAYFGTREQKEKYLPKLASGEWIAAFALSESGAGSDVLNIVTSGTLSADGTAWILNGEKLWVTNGAFADIFIVFAMVKGDQFSAFVVERCFSGVQVGRDEETISVRGASTCSLVLKNCRVPRENLLGEIGKGQKVAFNTLNIGRLRLGAAAIGSARASLERAAAYARQRKAFNKPLAEFGCIQEKIAWVAAGIYCGESMAYRTTAMLENGFVEIDRGSPESCDLFAKALEECAAECSILKVWGSELLQYAADEALQVFAGAGFAADHPAGRAYRDARLGRICQGTNEINRLIISVWVLKRAVGGKLRLGHLLKKVTDEVMMGPRSSPPLEGTMAAELELAEKARKATLMATGVIWQKYGMALVEQQEIITAFADMLIENYAIDCVVRRTQKVAGGNVPDIMTLALSHLCLARSLEKVEASARKVIVAAVEDDMLPKYLLMLRHLFSYKPFNTIALCRQIAYHVLEGSREAVL
jgi:alkylation response protein AidB-like acyl-CoA dehydrogenase